MFSGFTITLSSRPADIAKTLATPSKDFAASSNFSILFTYSAKSSYLAPGLAPEIESAICTIIDSVLENGLSSWCSATQAITFLSILNFSNSSTPKST